MWNAVETFLDAVFAGPMWPASVLMGLLLCYLVLSLIGAVDMDLDGPDADLGGDPGMDLDAADLPDAPDADFDVDVDAAAGSPTADLEGAHQASDLFGGAGAMTLRWLNLGKIPIIIWAGTFTLLFWSVSWLLWNHFDIPRYEPTLLTSVLLSIRNVVIAVGLTKLATGPMTRIFAPEPQYDAACLMGKECTVSTSKATAEFGQAHYRTDAAPLLLNIRTDGPQLTKGDRARIIGFDPHKRIYIVSQVDPEVPS
ncbi:OB-fold-containig protein [Roseimaritima sediminicola]|uniref:OB-fold-containig protein n=1 Tax=Roseimaritima sediminicola TaxID=2662066 RepID=UPI0012983DCD|nr:OB-fold-containig protein [Roseimaritima sediminicola]